MSFKHNINGASEAFIITVSKKVSSKSKAIQTEAKLSFRW